MFLDALVAMEKAMKRDQIVVNDRQLACAHIKSKEGQDYLKGMFAAGNYAWVNRSSMTFLTRQVSRVEAVFATVEVVPSLLPRPRCCHYIVVKLVFSSFYFEC